MHNKTPYGEGFADECRKKFEKLGGKVTSFSGVPVEEMDFRANINNIKSEGAEALFWGGMYSQAGPLYNQLRQAGLEIPLLSGDGSREPNFVEIVGPKAHNIYFTYCPDYRKTPRAQKFLEKYHAQFGVEGPYTIYGYEAANTLFEAIQSAQTTEAKQLASVLRSKSFETSLGPWEFDEKGDLKKATYVIWTVVDGKFSVYSED
jgi:branched-chain amino acid transport system substrate-binding protein